MLIPLLRRAHGAADPSEFDIAVYRDQLTEVERDLARGVIDSDTAERSRIEISRRILDADKAAGLGKTANAPKALSYAMALLAGGLVIGGSLAAYWHLGAPGYGDLPLQARLEAAQELRENRPGQAEAEAAAASRLPPPPAPEPQYAQLMERLRATIAERPDDLQGYELLAQNEAALGNYAAAHGAKAKVIALKGEGASSVDYVDLADMLVLAAGGYVSPEAEAAIARAIALDGSNGAARYYQGLLFAQTGRPDIAFGVWRRLLEVSAPDAPWVPAVRAQIGEVAFRAGEEYELPPVPEAPGLLPPSAGSAALPGPDQDQMDAAAEMSPAERMEMIQNMVQGLSERLASEGGTPPEWARLITALGVLGETERAGAIYRESLAVFAEQPAALDMLRGAAEQAGLAP